MTTDPIVESLCEKIREKAHIDNNLYRVIDKLVERSLVGQRKYGTTLTRTDLSQQDWIRHAQEEAMDLANYLEVLIVNVSCSMKARHKGRTMRNPVPFFEDAQEKAITIASELEAMLK